MILSRRRILISAVAAGAAAIVPGAYALPPVFAWTGRALGRTVALRLDGIDATEGRRHVQALMAEVDRLETVFSLHRPASQLARLNRDGHLLDPAPELVDVLEHARAVHDASAGAFDPTVQVLWRLYVEHVGRDMPSPDAIAQALRLVGFGSADISRKRVALPKAGMALTLNGIAQGYVTDRATAVLVERGLNNVVVDMGEVRAAGPRIDGSPWRIGYGGADMRRPADGVIALSSGAVATSAPAGTPLSPTGERHHILDPRSGLSASLYERVTVRASTAMAADAGSTALAVTAEGDIQRVLGGIGCDEARIRRRDGSEAIYVV